MSWQSVQDFETKVSNYFGASYGIAVDSCTHGIELCLRYLDVDELVVPKRTYLSVPMLANKLNLPLKWKDEDWTDYYYIGDTNIVDAAVLWKEDSYIPGTLMCLSFQFQKHLSLGRGGMILLDSEEDASLLRKMAYDGRARTDVAWWKQEIDMIGYHYYLSPAKAELGLKNFEAVKDAQVKKKDWDYYRRIDNYPIFKKKEKSF